jgi:hypothetical protein
MKSILILMNISLLIIRPYPSQAEGDNFSARNEKQRVLAMYNNLDTRLKNAEKSSRISLTDTFCGVTEL